MLYKIADLVVEVPTAGGMASRCREYLTNEEETPDIIVRDDRYRSFLYRQKASVEEIAYMESCSQAYVALLRFAGVYLHSSAVALNGKGYLFSGPCGMGKSTHTRLWQQVFGEEAKVFNDDKPALRRLEDRWYAYGTPWCGKDGININMKVPLAGICFLKQGPENKIRRLNSVEALQRILTQTIRRRLNQEQMDLMLSHVDKLIREIPIFELENRPEPAAALLSYETMRKAADLIDLKADFATINRLMFDTKSQTRLTAEASVISGMEYFGDGKLAVAVITLDLIKSLNLNALDFDGISALPRTVEGVEIGITIRQRTENEYKISCRSSVYADVSDMCAKLGGGGHKRAAGCQLTGDLETVKQTIVQLAKQYI